VQLANRRTEQLVHVLPESIQQRSLHLHILSEQLVLVRAQRCAAAPNMALPSCLVTTCLCALDSGSCLPPGCTVT
jgi:hypothetical protein